jgi:hypothetical protein
MSNHTSIYTEEFDKKLGDNKAAYAFITELQSQYTGTIIEQLLHDGSIQKTDPHFAKTIQSLHIFCPKIVSDKEEFHEIATFKAVQGKSTQEICDEEYAAELENYHKLMNEYKKS